MSTSFVIPPAHQSLGDGGSDSEGSPNPSGDPSVGETLLWDGNDSQEDPPTFPVDGQLPTKVSVSISRIVFFYYPTSRDQPGSVG